MFVSVCVYAGLAAREQSSLINDLQSCPVWLSELCGLV